MTPLQPELTYPATAAACALISSVFDVRSRRIPNFITMPAFLFGLALHLALGGWGQLFTALAAGIICGLVFLVFYLAGGMGAGDVKLIMAVGCIAGLSHVAYLLVLTALSGGAMAIVLAVARGRLQQTLTNVGALASHHGHEGLQPHPEINLSNRETLRLPYALAIAGGSLLTLYFQFQ
ncbi:MAG: A24 family peptidase [Acidobacteriaceae bacterium]|jgi:prepilin peptidase CpaA